ncbi:CpaE family protein [Actinoplanes sp. NPDC049599]|uniref:CpaE family protein n=1 Tax=Actinoplanes sp. NPDC049599 TaxID=3363903 RepID=UPI00379121C0
MSAAMMTVYCEPADGTAYPGTQSPRTVPEPGDLARELAAHPATSLVVLGPSVTISEAVEFAADQRLRRPALGVVLLRHEVAMDVLSEAIRAGVREVVAADDPAGVDDACARSLELSRRLGAGPAAAEPAQARIVTVFAGKGGVGKSTVAANLAVTLADGGRARVCLVDLDLQFGDIGILLQLVPEHSITDAITMAGRLDTDALRSLITPYRPGLDVLLAPAGPAEGDHVGRDVVREVLTVARSAYDFIVVDTAPYVTDHLLTALDLTDWFVLVVTPDLPTLKSYRLTLEMFDMLEYPQQRRLTLLNRADSDVGLSVSDIEKAVGSPMSVLMPSSRDVPMSVNRGVPLAVDKPGHPVSQAIRQLADRCAGNDTGQAPSRRRLRMFKRKG